MEACQMVKYHVILFFHIYASVHTHVHLLEFPDAMHRSEDSLRESGLSFTHGRSRDGTQVRRYQQQEPSSAEPPCRPSV